MIPEINLKPNAELALRKRYLRRDENGEVSETPEAMFRRVAGFVAGAEKQYGGDPSYWAERFYRLMADLRFLPNSPALMNAGRPLGQLAACFVLPVEDSMEGIFQTLKNAALILQSGGGTGFSFSRLRPNADVVRSTGGTASGPVSFLKIFNTATEVVRQGGARRGANMGVLRVDHPDIIEFIRMKRTAGSLENFNISVAVTDEFMEALYADREISLVNPRTRTSGTSVRAREIFSELVESAWETGDPGIIFLDTINRSNPTPRLGEIESTNPCGEQPLLPYEACILGSLNLASYAVCDRAKVRLDYQALSDDIMACVRFLDDAIDVSRYPLHDIEVMHHGNRKIGLGIMGWADLLIMHGMPYDSRTAFRFAEEVMKFITNRARMCSVELAKERGTFPNFHGSAFDQPGMPRPRNATVTTIAPTGTLSLIAGCSSGIEPLFSLAYKRLILDTEIEEVSGLFFETARREGFYSEDLRQGVMRTGTLRGRKDVPARIRRIFRTALEISYRDHIEMQAAFQRHTDNAVSKTVNLPKSASRKDVEKAFFLAYEKGCKGITVFRDGGKKGALVRIPDPD
ncbi:MAG: adenosylcobalamin-dependent ribonucleoside-diphosphate reductase [Thermodesulfovibrionales bacterium]